VARSAASTTTSGVSSSSAGTTASGVTSSAGTNASCVTSSGAGTTTSSATGTTTSSATSSAGAASGVSIGADDTTSGATTSTAGAARGVNRATGTSSNNDVLEHSSRSGRCVRRRIDPAIDEELCKCGCNKTYNVSSMSYCKGGRQQNNCRNRVNRSCVPNTWFCCHCSISS
jgi:hypothetical protein